MDKQISAAGDQGNRHCGLCERNIRADAKGDPAGSGCGDRHIGGDPVCGDSPVSAADHRKEPLCHFLKKSHWILQQGYKKKLPDPWISACILRDRDGDPFRKHLRGKAVRKHFNFVWCRRIFLCHGLADGVLFNPCDIVVCGSGSSGSGNMGNKEYQSI